MPKHKEFLFKKKHRSRKIWWMPHMSTRSVYGQYNSMAHLNPSKDIRHARELFFWVWVVQYKVQLKVIHSVITASKEHLEVPMERQPHLNILGMTDIHTQETLAPCDGLVVTAWGKSKGTVCDHPRHVALLHVYATSNASMGPSTRLPPSRLSLFVPEHNLGCRCVFCPGLFSPPRQNASLDIFTLVVKPRWPLLLPLSWRKWHLEASQMSSGRRQPRSRSRCLVNNATASNRNSHLGRHDSVYWHCKHRIKTRGKKKTAFLPGSFCVSVYGLSRCQDVCRRGKRNRQYYHLTCLLWPQSFDV